MKHDEKLLDIALRLSRPWYDSFYQYYNFKDKNLKSFALFCKAKGIITFDRTRSGLFSDKSPGLSEYLNGEEIKF